ncbi:MAG TPA: hypothetical protein VNM71_12295 [Steroidobacteraceae bacterium]|nr:hypothetical protein [Steroidobacteraceae bacterium]
MSMTNEQAAEPVAWLVYIPSEHRQEIYDSQDDPGYVDDLTNHFDAEVTPLFAAPQPDRVVELEAEVERLRKALEKFTAVMRTAQHNIASWRPSGSSDPESDAYDHDAFMWDFYQSAIDAAIAAKGAGS